LIKHFKRVFIHYFYYLKKFKFKNILFYFKMIIQIFKTVSEFNILTSE
jgi:hypothetical protein